ncbi:CPBP family intramembrane metalloprotease [Paenibacillus lautus]|nr:type II CAAX endopeptidase family protein [Paenibacillus lautus]MBU5346870.1 CPBP family intramembrane metalloprotease [Paenibacillus lautus]
MFWRVVLGWLAFVTGLGLAVVIATVAGSYQIPTLGLQILLAVVTTSISVPLIYLLRRYVDQRPWSGLGLSSVPSGFRYFLLGIGFLALVTAAALLIGSAAGWLRILDFHFPIVTMLVILINVPIAFFYEAFPEEITFRGYVYRNLNTRFPRWLALVLQVVMFVLAPIAVTAFMVAIGIGTWDLITVEYIINLVAFGTVLQLSRIVSNNLWMSIGFHLAWLEMVRYAVVPSQYAFIEIEYLSVWGSYMVTIGSVIIGIILLIVWSLRSKNRIDWNGIEPDLPPDSNPETKEALPAQSV